MQGILRLLAIAMAVVVTATGGLAENLVGNGGFEVADEQGNPAQWQADRRAQGTVTVDHTNAVVGAGCLHLQSPGGPVRLWSAPFSLAPGYHEVRWWCRTNSGVYQASFMLASATVRGRTDDTTQDGTTDWLQHRLLYYVDPPGGPYRVMLRLENTGEAWFGEISVEPTTFDLQLPPAVRETLHDLSAPLAYTYPVTKVCSGTPLPPAGERAEAIEVSLARGEHEAFQLLAREPVQVQTVRLDGLEGLPLAMTWHPVSTVEVPLSQFNLFESCPGPQPDILEPPQPTTQAWDTPIVVAIKASAECPAGIHRGRLVLEGGQRLEVPVSIRVWDFALPDEPAIRSFANFTVAGAARTDSRPQEAILADWFENARSHRVQPVRAVVDSVSEADWVHLAGGGVEIDWDKFDAAVEQYVAAGFEHFNIPPLCLRRRRPSYGFRPWLGLTPDDAQFGPALTDYCRQMGAHLRERGWLDQVALYLWDEPDEREYEPYLRILRMAREGDPDLQTAVAGAHFPASAFYGYIDRWTTNLRWHSVEALRERIAERQAAGEICGAYGNNRYRPQYPLVCPRLWYWQLYQAGLTETGWWSVAAWGRGSGRAPEQGQPVREVGSGVLLYPPAQAGERLRNSLRWEALRDGLEDYEYPALYAQKYGADAAQQMCERLVTGSRLWEARLSAAELLRVREELARAIEED